MPTPSIPIAERRPAAAAAAVGERLGNWRWYICGLLFAATTINYIDRQVIGILKPTLQSEFGWSEIDYADIVFAFQLAYAIGLLIAGRLMDRFGARLGFSLVIVVWSLAAMAHAEATWFGPGVAAVLAMVGLTYSGSVAGFIAARFALGLGEAGNFPASIKVIADWFPKKERALATGIFNSGTNVGALITPLVVPFVTVTWGWYWAFIATGFIGFFWLIVWWVSYAPPESHPKLSSAEFAHIRSDPADPAVRVPWSTLLKHRQTWAFALAKFMTDPVWWLYLFWIPDFLNRNYGINLSRIGPPLVVIYLIADIGSIGGGWLSSALIKRGWTPERRSEDGDARLRAGRASDPAGLEGHRPLGRGRAWSDWPPRRTRDGRRTSSRSRPTCSRARLSAPSSGWAAPRVRWAGC